MKVIKNIIAIILAVVILAGAAVGIGRAVTGTWDIRDWGKKPDTEQTTPITPDNGEMENGGAIVNESTASSGVKLMSARIATADYAANGISPQAETAYSITATVSPTTATNKTVSWSVAWANSSSSFANGKTVTDYVTVTPTADGSTTANISCLQPFGEQILITATARSNSEISATATVDYVKRVSSFNVAFNASEVKLDTTYNFTITPVYSVGTLQGELTTSNYDFVLSDGFKSAIESRMNVSYVPTLSYRSPSFFTIDEAAKTFKFDYPNAFLNFAHSNADKLTSIRVRDDFNNAFTLAAGEYTQNHATFKLNYSYTYNGTVYSNGNAEVGLKFDAASLIIYPTNITLSQTSFVF